MKIAQLYEEYTKKRKKNLVTEFYPVFAVEKGKTIISFIYEKRSE